MREVTPEWKCVEDFKKIMKGFYLQVKLWFFYALLDSLWEDYDEDDSHESDLKKQH